MHSTVLLAAALAFLTSGTLALPQDGAKAKKAPNAASSCNNIGLIVKSHDADTQNLIPELTGWTGHLWKNFEEEWSIQLTKAKIPEFFPFKDGVMSRSDKGDMVFRNYQTLDKILYFSPTFVPKTKTEPEDHPFTLTVSPDNILGVKYDGDLGETSFYLCQVEDENNWELQWHANINNAQGSEDPGLCVKGEIVVQCK